MALIVKREDLIHVPWSSVEEWLEVYKQVYSGNLIEQNKAYETLLVWKARIPKLPVGVECTLGLMQVFLRDQEWTPKINNGEMLINYENDLRMMYSTVIMKFLNHISNIANTRQISLFVIAKQLNIPNWIVNLRHDIAHGHELPSIDVMRVVANILLTWIHEEYWSAEAKNLHEPQHVEDAENHDSEDEENLVNLIELWTAIGLYVETNHVIVSDLPNEELRDTLNNFFIKLNASITKGSSDKGFSLTDETELSIISNLLLSEISKNLSKGDSLLRREQIVIDSILSNEAFLVNSEILSIFLKNKSYKKYKNCLPLPLIKFWKKFLLLMQDKKILFTLFLQLIELMKSDIDTNNKLMASLWIKTIAQAFRKQKIARQIHQTLEQKLDHEKQKISTKLLIKMVETEVVKCFPELKNILSLNISGDFPNCLTDASFIRRLILSYNEYSEHYIPVITWFLDCDSIAKEKLKELMKVHSKGEIHEEMKVENTENDSEIYTVENIKQLQKEEEKTQQKEECNSHFIDSKVRNTSWKIASDDCDWSVCPIGVLPWQIGDFQSIEPLTVSPSEVRYAIVKDLELPNIVDSNKLKWESKIQWENLIRKNKKVKRKSKSNKSISTTSFEEEDTEIEAIQSNNSKSA